MNPTGSNVSIVTNLHWDREDWRNSSSMDLTALYGMQQQSFLPYLSAYHPYNNFPMAYYQSYFRFQNYFASQLTLDPYFFNYYECLDTKNLYASLFGKHYYLLSRALYSLYNEPRSRLRTVYVTYCVFFSPYRQIPQ